MKRWVVVVMAAAMLAGCGTAEVLETISDQVVQPVVGFQRDIVFSPPVDAVIPSMVSEDGDQMYLCGDYVLMTQTRESGDLDETFRAVSGYGQEALTVLQTEQDDMKRYDFTWVSAGEGGAQVGRAAVLDDGSYHYILSVMAAEEDTGALAQGWDTLFRSFAAV